MAKDIGSMASREVAELKARAGASNIRDDLETLREDAITLKDDALVLGKDLKKEGKRQYDRAEAQAREAYDSAKVKGQEQLDELVSYVQRNPGSSLVMAFAAGFIAKILLTDRR